jgi:hypothetical protein
MAAQWRDQRVQAAEMTVHLVKLCVGCDTVQDLKDWQDDRLKQLKRAGKTPELCHRTLQAPAAEEVLTGFALLVIRAILVRQRILDLRPDIGDDGTACCGIVLDRELVATGRRQGARSKAGAIFLPTTRRRISAWSAKMRVTCREPCAPICASFVLSIFRRGRHIVDQPRSAERQRHTRRA